MFKAKTYAISDDALKSTVSSPDSLLSKKNAFLKIFVNTRMILVLSVLLTIILIGFPISMHMMTSSGTHSIVIRSTLKPDSTTTASTLSLNPTVDLFGCDSNHETYDMKNESILGNYTQFSIAVDNGYCSTVGKEILLMNGSAIDAAIASGLCNGIMNSQSAGIGGGHFMVIYLKEKNVAYAIDAREAAPSGSTRDMFVENPQLSLYGGLATAIPGEIAGYWLAHKLGGKLEWKKLFEPVIDMCSNGFQVSAAMAASLKANEKYIKADAGLKRAFVSVDTGEVVKKGQVITLPQLAATFRTISESNVSSFYSGSLAEQMVDEINQHGGNVSLNDFRTYRPLLKKPLLVRLDDDLQILTPPLPSSGILVTAIMRIMRTYNLMSELENASGLFHHRLIETFKHVFAHRAHLGDERFVNSSQEIVDKLLDENYLLKLQQKINDSRTYEPPYYGLDSLPDDHGTAHISVLDQNGNAVSLTSSINTYFGAKYAGEKTGIIYNNQMDDFSIPGQKNVYGIKPSETNFIEPGKRPLSSMSPIIILDTATANTRLVMGASGGPRIITAVAKAAIGALWQNKSLKEAIDEPRVHHQLIPDVVGVERNVDQSVKDYLLSKGHKLVCFNTGGSIVQAIQVVNDTLIQANSDYRKGGYSDGV